MPEAKAPLSLNLDQWADWRWRLSNLYWIVTDEGKKVLFSPNEEQLELIHNLWYLNLILKARQLGFTTVIDLLLLDQCVFSDNKSAGIVAHKLDDARKIFRNKIKFPYDHLPDGIRKARPLETDTSWELVFDNGSSIGVGTSMRSGTLQYVHVSEFGYICAHDPEKANEIVTGTLNAVHAGQYVFIESTAKGRTGYFFEYAQRAQKSQQEDAKLSALDFRFHFFPWWLKKSNRLDPKDLAIPAEYQRYFEKLKDEKGIRLDAAQRAWYAKKAELMNSKGMGDSMKREHPSTSEEAFEVAILGAYYATQMVWLRKHDRIRKVPCIPSVPVNTFWELGRNDLNAIWFHQYVGGDHRFIDYYENSGEDLAHYVKDMQDRGYLYDRYFLPHDAENANLERNESRVDRLIELGVPANKIVVVPRVEQLETGIELVREKLPLVWIDKENCSEGIACLDSYTKAWNDKQETWQTHPANNWGKNGADAFRQWAQGWEPAMKPRTRRKAASWRTA